MALRDMVIRPADLPARLGALPGWQADGAGIARDYAAGWDEAAAMVPAVASLAVEMEHRPDIDIRWTGLRVFLVTHTAGDVLTELDLAMAVRLDAIAAEHGVPGVLSDRCRSSIPESLRHAPPAWESGGASSFPGR